MAAKKTAKKTTESAPKEAAITPTPVAKKATKTAAKSVKKTANGETSAPPANGLSKKANGISSTPAAKKPAAKPSLDDIARAAYLNYRRRVDQGLPGDSHGDWLEAERQAAVE